MRDEEVVEGSAGVSIFLLTVLLISIGCLLLAWFMGRISPEYSGEFSLGVGFLVIPTLLIGARIQRLRQTRSPVSVKHADIPATPPLPAPPTLRASKIPIYILCLTLIGCTATTFYFINQSVKSSRFQLGGSGMMLDSHTGDAYTVGSYGSKAWVPLRGIVEGTKSYQEQKEEREAYRKKYYNEDGTKKTLVDFVNDPIE